MRFVDAAVAAFAHVILVPGNHEHYDGVFEDTAALLRRYLDSITILDNETVDIGGVRFFGTTLWTDLSGRNEAASEPIRRGMGEYFFCKTHHRDETGNQTLGKLRPAHTLAAHDKAVEELRRIAVTTTGPLVIVTHHAPSLQGLNPMHKGNGLDGAFASDLEDLIEGLPGTPYWVHGHTHIRKRYRVGNTTLLANCRGFDGKDLSARKFTPDCWFDL